MSKKTHKPTGKPTRKSVLAYAAELREAAERARLADPNVDLYAPTDEAASRLIYSFTVKVGGEDAPAAALVELARRARLRELETAEEGARASAARSAHRAHQLRAAGARDADLSRLSFGERLDRALLGLGLVSEAGASRALDAEDRVSGGRGVGAGLPRVHDRHAELERRVRELVADAERLSERARRQLVELEGTAA